MPAYRFEALDASGKTSSGLLEADNAKAARAQLRTQALVLWRSLEKARLRLN